MVRAILDGRKTVTRRIVKIEDCSHIHTDFTEAEWRNEPMTLVNNGGKWYCKYCGNGVMNKHEGILCPYGNAGDIEWQNGMPPAAGYYYVKGEFDGKPVYLQPVTDDGNSIVWGWHEGDDVEDISMDGGPTPETILWKRAGDVLWVRETFYRGYVLDENDAIPENAELATWYFADTRDARPADMSDDHCYHLFGVDKKTWPAWKPSIHMPKVAARIWMEVMNVRVERLHDISDVAAIDEGILTLPSKWVFEQFPDYKEAMAEHVDGKPPLGPSPKERFAKLWQMINGVDSWQANPWVWVVEFKVLSTTGKPDNLK